jgi:hypothetical protein
MQSEFHLRPIAYRPLGRAGLFVNAKPLVFGMGVATPHYISSQHPPGRQKGT